jgi:Putative peptidoglycan binding domain
MDVEHLRGDKDGEWLSFRSLSTPGVADLQTKLKAAGFSPNGTPSGVFDYRTLSAVRLFQEYVRSVEGLADIGAPDGRVGPKTVAHLQRWAQAGNRAEWALRSPGDATAAFRYWHMILSLYQAFSRTTPLNRIKRLVEADARPSDTLKLAQWNLDRSAIHLIGVRRQEWQKATDGVRRNDDVFVLLINGVTFGFAGSTDPSPKMADRPDEAFVVPGQHRYRFGWHLLKRQNQVYRAFRPVTSGVLACRDNVNDDALTDADLVKGLNVVPDINIHWSGIGTTNWSGGCQVIGGRRYVNHRGAVVDCSAFAAVSYSGLVPKTRGAYDVLVDLVTVFAPSDASTGTALYYTLLYEGDLGLMANANQTIDTVARANLPAGEVEPFVVGRLLAQLVI